MVVRSALGKKIVVYDSTTDGPGRGLRPLRRAPIVDGMAARSGTRAPREASSRRATATRRSALRVVIAVAIVSIASCADESWRVPRPIPSEHQPAAARALDYLETTDDELGLDVVVAIQLYAELTGDARALEVAEVRREGLRASDVERFGALFEVSKQPLPPATLDVGPGPASDPDDELDDRVASCPEEILGCRVSPECAEMIALDGRGGYVLTHQAVWLVFHEWMGCTSSIDVEERRRAFAAALVRETRADRVVSDLYAERLAMLGQLGFASAIEREWIDALLAAQREEGCFPASDAIDCHPHPTGLALWTLAHTRE